MPVRAVLYLAHVHPRYTAGRHQVYERYTVVRPVSGKPGRCAWPAERLIGPDTPRSNRVPGAGPADQVAAPADRAGPAGAGAARAVGFGSGIPATGQGVLGVPGDWLAVVSVEIRGGAARCRRDRRPGRPREGDGRPCHGDGPRRPRPVRCRPGCGLSRAGPGIGGITAARFQPASCGVDAGDSGWHDFLGGAELAQQVGGGLGGDAEAGAERVAGDGLAVLVLVLVRRRGGLRLGGLRPLRPGAGTAVPAPGRGGWRRRPGRGRRRPVGGGRRGARSWRPRPGTRLTGRRP